MFQKNRDTWLRLAEQDTPELRPWVVEARDVVVVEADPSAFQNWRARSIASAKAAGETVLDAGQNLVLDFGEHLVGTLSWEVDSPGQAILRPMVAEVPAELVDPIERYPGKLEARWQPEAVAVAAGRHQLVLPRRQALRYVRFEVMECQGPLRILLAKMEAVAATGPNLPVMDLPNGDEQSRRLRHMDQVAMRTLRNCMQDVFEDGPKRDRRLWLGDLRLQALAAYPTLGGHDLVRRCLYLLAACARPDGFVPACVFAKPQWHHASEFIPDYTLLFAPTVLDYAQASGDWDTARELWPFILHQATLPTLMIDDQGLVRDRGDRWLFIDWCAELNREAPMQGVFIYGLGRTMELGRRLGVPDSELGPVAQLHHKLQQAAESLWDEARGCYVSGPKRQVSWASQVWMILSGTASAQRGRRAMQGVMSDPTATAPRTPYLYHHVVDALWHCGMIDEARQTLSSYWGGMLDRGASTFWEVFDPSDDHCSPYASHLVNSYCHAWSCTPSWFIRGGLFNDEAAQRRAEDQRNTQETSASRVVQNSASVTKD